MDLRGPPVLMQGLSQGRPFFCVKGGDLALLEGLGLLG